MSEERGVGMKEFRFDSVRLLLASADGGNRQALKKALVDQGFRRIVEIADMAPAVAAVAQNTVDVLVIDAALPGGDVCALVGRLRHHKIGNNPFVVTLVLTDAATEATVKRIIDSGADDLLVKPFSPELLIQRIAALARARKPFVVTHDYIGPDRRKSARPGAQGAPLIDVPNPLRSKAVANADAKSLQRLIDAAATQINHHKMERYAAQIAYLAEQVTPHFRDGRLTAHEPGVLAQLVDNLRRIAVVAEDLGLRMRGTPHAHVAELALSLIGVAGRIVQIIAPSSAERAEVKALGSEVELLSKVALALRRAFSLDEGAAKAAHEISQSVQDFAQRKQAPAQASGQG